MCGDEPKAYVKLVDPSDPEGPWTCVTRDQCAETGFVSIAGTECLPIDDADAECSGSLLGDIVKDAAGNEYTSFRRLVDGKCECLPGVGPSESADGRYCTACEATEENHIEASEIVAPYDPKNSCKCKAGYVTRFQPDYGYSECLPECPDEPYALLSRDGQTCFLQALVENCGINEVMYDISGKTYLRRCNCAEGYAIGPTGNCTICADHYRMIDGHCVAVLPTPMDIADKCAYPLKKTLVDSQWTCDECPLEAPYAKFDEKERSLTACVAYSECERPEVRYFAELNRSFAVCSPAAERSDFKHNGLNTTVVSRAVSLLGGKRHVATVSADGQLQVRRESEKQAFFSVSDAEYVRSARGDGFIVKKTDGQYYWYRDSEVESGAMTPVASEKKIAKVDGSMESLLFIYEDGTIACSSSLEAVCERLQEFALDRDGTLYRKVHDVLVMDERQIVLQMRNGSVAYASTARGARYDNLSYVLEIGAATYYLYHDGRLFEEKNGKLEVIKTGIQQILADKGKLYAIDAESVGAEVGMKRLRTQQNTQRRVGEYRSFRFEWNQDDSTADPCLEYTYKVSEGKYICKERQERQDVDHGEITGTCEDDFTFVYNDEQDACVCEGIVSLEGKCVEACPANQENVDGVCVCANGFTLAADGKSCECLGHIGADGNTCLPECGPAAPVVGADNTCRKCDTDLDGGVFWNGESCVPACPESHDADGVCKRCVELNKNAPFWNSTDCTVCPEDKPAWTSDGCVACIKADKGKPVWNGAECAACPDGQHYDVTNGCVGECPADTPVVNADNICEGCQNPAPYFDQGRCKDRCSDVRPVVDESMHCHALCEEITANAEAGLIYWTGSRCVNVCPKTTPIADETLVCKACSGETPLYDPVEKKCVGVCPTSAPVSDQYKHCTTCAILYTDTGFIYWNGTRCVQLCPEATIDGKCASCASIDETRPLWNV